VPAQAARVKADRASDASIRRREVFGVMVVSFGVAGDEDGRGALTG
jgi:hypothetical protein